MYVSEDTFGHLRQAADEQQRRELEYRRIAHERADTTSSTRGGLRAFIDSYRRSAHPVTRPLPHP